MKPLRAFKFRKINDRLIDSIAKSELYFSTPGNLNDPFDCKINIRKSLENAISLATEPDRGFLTIIRDQLQPFFNDVERDIQTYGVWSYSRKLLNPLMWAHYGDEHKGVCLAYRLPDKFWNHELGEVIGVSAVDYGGNLIAKWFLEKAKTFRSEEPGGFTRFGVALIVQLLTAKDSCWKYEKENRIVARHPGPKAIPKDSLIQVCFGLSTETKDIDKVCKALTDNGYTANLCKMDRNKNDFGLQVVEI